MTPQELDQLIAALTDEERQQLLERLLDEAGADPASVVNRRFVKSLLGGDDS